MARFFMYIVLCLPIDFILIAVFPLGITGAENDKEVKNLFQKSYTLIGISSILITVICRFSSPYLAQLFVEYSKELLEITVKAFSLYCFTFLFSGLNTMKSAFFIALNNGKISACISFVRTLLFQTTCILLLPQLFGPDGIWLSTACAEILVLTISIYFLITRKNEYRY